MTRGIAGNRPGTRDIAVAPAHPREVREEVIDLFWEHRHWPGESREDYARLWDWRYGFLGEGEPPTWIARGPDGMLIAHLAIFPRRFRLGGQEIRCALPGDVLVHRAWRAPGLTARMILLPGRFVAAGQADIVLVVGSQHVHRLCTRMGYRDLGTYHVFVDVRRSRALLTRRVRPAAALAAGVDLLLSGRRRILQRRSRRHAAGLRVRPLAADTVANLDRGHWRPPPDRLVACEGAAYLAGRFLRDPLSPRQMFGLFGGDGRVEGHVAVELRGDRAVICDCRVNAERLDEVSAIGLVANQLPGDVGSIAVPARPDTAMARELRAAGFLRRAPDDADAPLRISAWWSPQHPAAERLARLDHWNLYASAADG